MEKQKIEELIEKAKTTGKVTNCLGIYLRPGNSCYSKPEEVRVMLLQLFLALDYNHKKK